MFIFLDNNLFFIAGQALTSLPEKYPARLFRAVSIIMNIKILKLDYKHDYDFLLVGIISACRDYQLCYELNQNLKLDFQRKEDVTVPAGKPGSQTCHSYFCCPGRDGGFYHVITNRDKNGTGFFIPEMRSIDYFLLVCEVPGNFDLTALVKSIREIKNFSGAFAIEPSEMKSAEAFIMLLEG